MLISLVFRFCVRTRRSLRFTDIDRPRLANINRLRLVTAASLLISISAVHHHLRFSRSTFLARSHLRGTRPLIAFKNSFGLTLLGHSDPATYTDKTGRRTPRRRVLSQSRLMSRGSEIRCRDLTREVYRAELSGHRWDWVRAQI